MNFKLVLISGALFACFEVSAVEFPLTKALAMIETGCKDTAIGKAGERSRYQIKRIIWVQYKPQLCFKQYAKDRVIATEVALCHMNWLRKAFIKRTKREPTLYDMYVLWNKGFYGYSTVNFKFEKLKPSMRERATRFSNLCFLYTAQN